MHEIITVQLGQRSNYLATHFWNTQESYFTYDEGEDSEVDPNIHFRPGVGTDSSDTFTPRTLIYDLKGGFGTLRQYNALYDVQAEADAVRGLWDGSTVIQRQPTIESHQYQRSLELGEAAPVLRADTVRYWSDFNRVFFHPKSIVQLNEYELNSQIMPFENWSAGEDLFRDIDKEVDILDRDLRPFAEECDQISAFQLFTGADDAWGGFASNYVDRIRDEYGKTSLWTIGLENTQPDQRRQRLLRSENVARTLHSIANQASAYIRIASPIQSRFPYIHLQPQSEWYNSALSTLGIESFTLPSRVRSSNSHRSVLFDFEAILNAEGSQTIFELSTSIADPTQPTTLVNGHSNGTTAANIHSAPHDQAAEPGHALPIDLTPADPNYTPPRHDRTFAQIVVSRGPLSSSIDPTSTATDSTDPPPPIETYALRTAFPLLSSFPQDLLMNPRTTDGGGAAAVSVRSALTTTSRTQARLRALKDVVRYAAGVEDRETLYSGLADLGERYASGWMSDEEEEDGEEDD